MLNMIWRYSPLLMEYRPPKQIPSGQNIEHVHYLSLTAVLNQGVGENWCAEHSINSTQRNYVHSLK